MVSNKERGKTIRRQILRDIKHHPKDIAKHICNIFSISRPATYYHLKKLEADGWLTSQGKSKGKQYFLGDRRSINSLFELFPNFSEDKAWREHSIVFEGLPENIVDICQYGLTEMVNNAIDHSEGKDVYVSSERSEEKVTIAVGDTGEGIFRRIKRLCNLVDERQALLELSKGKLTTDPENHTGEGVFFTSRAFDYFEIESKGLTFSHQDELEFDILKETDMPPDEIGTFVYMSINRDTERTIKALFDSFTSGPDDFRFNKTIIPVKLAAYENEKLVSRSQAKRLLTRIERFTNVVLDFNGVGSIGQAFADEIFRVYAKKHPEIMLLPVEMNDDVTMMVNRALSEREI